MQLAYIKLRTLQTKSKELKELELIIELNQLMQQMKTNSKLIHNQEKTSWTR